MGWLYMCVSVCRQELVPGELVALQEGKEDKSSPGNSSHSLDSFEGEVRDPLSHDSDSICSDDFFDPEAMIGEEGPPPVVVQPVSVSVMSEDEPSGEWGREGRGRGGQGREEIVEWE